MRTIPSGVFRSLINPPNQDKLVERENFWVYKLRTMREEGGLNVQEVPVTGKKRVKEKGSTSKETEEGVCQAGRGRGNSRGKKGKRGIGVGRK